MPGDTEVLWAGTTGWNMNTSIRFQITHLPAQGIIRLKLHEGATLLYDEEIVDNGAESLRGGRLGVYCASQDSVLWSALRYRLEDLYCIVHYIITFFTQFLVLHFDLDN